MTWTLFQELFDYADPGDKFTLSRTAKGTYGLSWSGAPACTVYRETLERAVFDLLMLIQSGLVYD